jgi:hypothetical protein
VAFAERPHDGRHHVVRDGGEEADPQLARLSAGGAADGLDDALGLGEHRSRLAQQDRSDIGELDSAGAPLEQSDPELVLQPPYLLR